MSKDYNATVNLPKTDFPMRAALPKREPDMLKEWDELDLYHEMLRRTEGREPFILHDGPPFSNGMIHMGTALNKCIKDFITRYKSMSGRQAVYIPGWDNHGMPIESAIIKEQKLNHKEIPIPEFRDACHDFAERFVQVQMAQFRRLGVVGDWANPYRTMDPKFEAEEVRIFGEMYKKGYIYKGKKPVYWCPHDETALAEAEIEYAEDACKSIYVKFRVADDKGKLSKYCDLSKLYFVIWTTTTWTIPGNLAICLNANLDYVLAKTPDGEVYVLAKELAEKVAAVAGIESFELLAELKGSEFEFMTARHPLAERDSIVLLGDHVTLDAGTGCVHTAPGHGHEDYEICRKYDAAGKTNIGIVVPVDDHGRMNEDAGKYLGLTTDEANVAIFDDLKACGALLASEDIIHQYAHCWRCKKPILYRATDQWFCSVDAFKEEACAAADAVKWTPEWGHDRMISMIRERADWCISRQRRWGLPIPVFYCSDCGKPVCTEDTIASVASVFKAEGSNAWFRREAEELMPHGFKCPFCGGTHFTKESDTLDGWFDSGSTHIASMELDAPGTWPASMYMEGLDQYRGWFQSSLLVGVAVKGAAPYREVLTHGWTVDGEGKAMHKSLGNGVYPDEIIPKYGADLIRLWAASADYRMDVRCSEGIFQQLSEKYLKIRNTARFILGNLAGFDPNHQVAYADMTELDKWAMDRLGRLIEKCLAAYEKYEFFGVSYAIHNFCVVELSNFYLDVIKDRLYCDGTDSLSRRSAQTAIYLILDAMVRLLAPTLSFTANEIWLAMPHAEGDDLRNVMLNDMPAAKPEWRLSAETEENWQLVQKLREDVNKALELSRASKTVGKPLDARLTLYVSDKARADWERIKSFDLPALCIVSELEAVMGEGEGFSGEGFPGVTVAVAASTLGKCPRCWTHSASIGADPEHPELCARCAAAIK
ncbi:MAG: isoleucine--tRNA ligase [Oscillospiraceae bacterium]